MAGKSCSTAAGQKYDVFDPSRRQTCSNAMNIDFKRHEYYVLVREKNIYSNFRMQMKSDSIKFFFAGPAWELYK